MSLLNPSSNNVKNNSAISKEVLNSEFFSILKIQWGVLVLIVSIYYIINKDYAVSALLAGLSIVIPYTIICFWFKARLNHDRLTLTTVVVGGSVKFLLSLLCLGLSLFYLKQTPLLLVWHSFFIGFVSVIFIPFIFKLFKSI